jgi:hypothetical protein
MSRTVIPYRTFPDGLDSHAYSAVIRVQLAPNSTHAVRTRRFEAIVDSGATRCHFHSGLAGYLGIDLRSGISEITNGIGGQEEVWLHDLTLYIPGGPVKIRAGFKDNLPIAGLLGMAGFFDNFNITFEAVSRQCILERIYRV